VKKDNKKRLFEVMGKLNESFTSSFNEAVNPQQLQRFLSDLGYGDMYYKYKNNPQEMERVFSKLLKGRNLNAFLKLIHPQPSPEEKRAERQKQKDDTATEKYNIKAQEYNNVVSQLIKLSNDKLIEKYAETFKISPEKATNMFYDDEGVDELMVDTALEEKREDITERIATELVYGKKGLY
jgi:hypothetical protein